LSQLALIDDCGHNATKACKLVGSPAAVAEIGRPGLHFHDLRHTGNTRAAATGTSLRDLMARMGHDSPDAALIYQHATSAADRAIAKALGEAMTRVDDDDDQGDDDPDGGPAELVARGWPVEIEWSSERSKARVGMCPDLGLCLLERVTRIELALSAWEADVLPLNYTRKQSGPYSNRLHHVSAPRI
jgi:hypothetical protein